VQLVHRSFVSLLGRHGLSEIETNGRFDPHVHEALLTQPGEGVEEGSVLQVLQKGYRLGDRVLRPFVEPYASYAFRFSGSESTS